MTLKKLSKEMDIFDYKFYMAQLIKLSEKCLEDDLLPVAAMIVDRNGEILSKQRKGLFMHPRTGHAEIAAINDALYHRKWLKNCTIITTLEPCMMCTGYILNTHANIAYALADPYGGNCSIERFQNLPPRHIENPVIIRRGILEEEAKKVFKKFFLNTKQPFWKNHPNNPLIRLVMEKW